MSGSSRRVLVLLGAAMALLATAPNAETNRSRLTVTLPQRTENRRIRSVRVRSIAVSCCKRTLIGARNLLLLSALKLRQFAGRSSRAKLSSLEPRTWECT